MRDELTGAVCPNATTAAKRPAWAISESYWNGRTLYDISWRDFMRLPGVTKKIAARSGSRPGRRALELARKDLQGGDGPLKFRELFEDRVEEGLIDNEAFAAMRAKIAAEFEAQPKKRRRRGRGRPIAQVEPAPTFDIVEELH